jgi:hypothetical protein
MTTATIVHTIPNASHNHHSLETAWTASRSFELRGLDGNLGISLFLSVGLAGADRDRWAEDMPGLGGRIVRGRTVQPAQGGGSGGG